MLDVTCAVIERRGLVLAARRGPSMHLPFEWEFPGGKLRKGEEERECLVREVREELSIGIEPIRRLGDSEHDYGDKHVRLIPYVCRFVSGEIVLHEHDKARWLRPDGLKSLNWCAADIPVLREYLRSL
jgi:8-oxo-dGTP diphosphatase